MISDCKVIHDGKKSLAENVAPDEIALFLSAAYAYMAAIGVLESFVEWSRDMEIGVAMIEEMES